MRIFLAVAALLLAATVATAQTPKVIGTPQQPQIVPSMIVINAQGAKIANQKLVLDGVSPNAIVFADRPIRAAGHAMTSQLLEEWSDSSADSFAKDPPNATISVMNKEKGKVSDAVVVLKSPKLEGERLTFDIAAAGRRHQQGRRSGNAVHRHHRPAGRAAHRASQRVVRRRQVAAGAG